LIYQNQTDPAKAASLVNFVGWALSAGQDSNGALSYAPWAEAFSVSRSNNSRRSR
jgi:hypothetical protein